ncbi:hypothetical protein C0Q70_11763 [Pomacea canaliculata]|uniref:EF-hand domain-containing protein n=1 Tax=Pomacea canaliculata TaxID=400727 RepID=A0A2T7P6Z6_POMCA|nr:hypothetical protein C0Q70_11763 [Pomacea canaliculata]
MPCFNKTTSFFPLSNQTPQEQFKYLDTNGNGILKEDDILEFIKKNDKNGDESLDFDEFIGTRPPSEPPLRSKGAFNLYDKMDVKKDGKMSSSLAPAFIKLLDKDKNGEVTFQEFEERIKKIVDGIDREAKKLEKK